MQNNNNNNNNKKLHKQLTQLSNILQAHKEELIIKLDEGVLGAALPSYLEYLEVLKTLHIDAKSRLYSLSSNNDYDGDVDDTSNNEIEDITSSFASFSLPPPSPSSSLSSFSFGSSFGSPSFNPSSNSSNSPHSFGAPSFRPPAKSHSDISFDSSSSSSSFGSSSFGSPSSSHFGSPSYNPSGPSFGSFSSFGFGSSFSSPLPVVPAIEIKKERTILPKPNKDQMTTPFFSLKAHWYILHETASGYALFELLQDLENDEATYYSQSFSLLQEAVKLSAFHPFTSSKDSMLAYKDIREGTLPTSLIDFLKQNLPQNDHEGPCLVTVDRKLRSNISDALGIKLTSSPYEIFRGLREFFTDFYANYVQENAETQEAHAENVDAMKKRAKDAEEREIRAQTGVGHQLSAEKVKYDEWMVDQYVVLAVGLLDQVDLHVNSVNTKLRDCYSIHFPELARIVFDYFSYAKVVKRIKDKKNISQIPKDELALIVGEYCVDQVYSVARCSIGTEMLELDFKLFDELSDQIINLVNYRQKLSDYIRVAMTKIAPSLYALMGELGARLLARAGSLINLAKLPASTIQLMGAEKALFRALKTNGLTPKYGLLFHSPYLQMSLQKDKGKVARFVANKVSIAARIDSFSSDKTDIFGKKLAQQVNDKLKYIRTGEKPRKNVDVMRDAMVEHNLEILKKRKL